MATVTDARDWGGFGAKLQTLSLTLQAAVPLWAVRMKPGGPSPADLARAGESAGLIAEKGDVLQFGGRPGEAADLFNRLAHGIAVLSFCPGGVKFAGVRYESHPDVPGVEMGKLVPESNLGPGRNST